MWNYKSFQHSEQYSGLSCFEDAQCPPCHLVAFGDNLDNMFPEGESVVYIDSQVSSGGCVLEVLRAFTKGHGDELRDGAYNNT